MWEKSKIDDIKHRAGYKNINAVKNNRVFELDPAIFLQPGPPDFRGTGHIDINF